MSRNIVTKIVIKSLSVASFILLLTTAQAAATTVSIADVVVEPNDVVTLPIMVNDITDYGSGTIRIWYDHLVVHVTEITGSSNSTITSVPYTNNSIGYTSISASNPSGTTGDIVFANVKFTVVGVGSSPLNLVVSSLYDNTPTSIPRSISNGSITVEPIPGDVNIDGHLTTADVTIVLQMAVRGEYSEVADVSGDDTVTSLDALMILQAVDQEGLYRSRR